jgi:RHS repeat-associated protein
VIKINYPGSGNNSQFTYDGYGHVVKIIETSSGTITSTKQFVWTAHKMRESRDASGVLTAQYFNSGQTVSGTSYFYTTDHLRSVREMTSSTGSIAAQYFYDSYGRSSKIQGSLASDAQYAGYYTHPPSGLNLAEYRGYASKFGRWLKRDPIGEFGDINLYRYALGNPINFRDPSGLDVIIMLDPSALGGIGHCGVLVGNENSGWTYASNSWNNQENNVRYGKLTWFYNDPGTGFNYSPGNSAWFPATPEQDQAGLDAARRVTGDPYDLFRNNCADLCRRVAEAAGINLGPEPPINTPRGTFNDALNAGGVPPSVED